MPMDNEYKLPPEGHAAVPDWAIKTRIYTFKYVMLAARGASTMGAAFLLYWLHFGAVWLDDKFKSWVNQRIDAWRSEIGDEAMSRDREDHHETDGLKGPEVPDPDIKGEGPEPLGSFPHKTEERSTPESHHEDESEEEEADDDGKQDSR